jgi:hypothetical protein
VIGPEDARRYRVIVTRVAGEHVLHVIDSQTDRPGAAPRDVRLSLMPERLGGAGRATLVDADAPLQLEPEGGRTSLVVRPDPVATVVLKRE